MDVINLRIYVIIRALQAYVRVDFTNSRIPNNTNLANLQLRGFCKFSLTRTFTNLRLYGFYKFIATWML